MNILEDLKRRAAKMAQESSLEHIYYALFSRRGFTNALKEQALRDEIGLFLVDDLVQGGSQFLSSDSIATQEASLMTALEFGYIHGISKNDDPCLGYFS